MYERALCMHRGRSLLAVLYGRECRLRAERRPVIAVTRSYAFLLPRSVVRLPVLPQGTLPGDRQSVPAFRCAHVVPVASVLLPLSADLPRCWLARQHGKKRL